MFRLRSGRALSSAFRNIQIQSSAFVLGTLLFTLIGCGGNTPISSPNPAPLAVSVTVSPSTATLNVAKSQTFTATVANATNTAVTWSIQEGNAGGTITTAGVYNAPNTSGTYHVVATSQADPSKSATATITVVPAVSVSINPGSATVAMTQSQTFTVAVTNSTNSSVTWSVQEGAAGGTVTAAGVYTAPSTPGTYHVVATSQADTSKSATATITVPAVAVSVNPNGSTIYVTQSQTFTATVTNSTNTAVTWSVQEGAAGGTVTAAGIYTAPNTPGTYHVVVTSQADPSKSATVTITVDPSVVTFSSNAPTNASEGLEYTYTISAGDSAGASVSYTLTTKPTGASITGNALSWTPTAAQARVPNNFTVTATSSTGSTADQSWSVTPSGTVHGTRMIDYNHASGTTSVPDNMSLFTIKAHVPDGMGGFTTLNGAGDASGNYSIQNVPGGFFWLQQGAGTFIWTSTSTIDTGYDMLGRSDVITASAGTKLDLQLSNLNSTQTTDYLELFTANSRAVGQWVPGAAGFTNVSGPVDWNKGLADSSEGDVSYIGQLVTTMVGSYQFRVMGGNSGPMNLTMTNGGTTTITQAMQAQPTATLRANIRGTAFNALTSQTGPGAITYSTSLYFSAAPFRVDRGLFGPWGNLVFYEGQQGAITTNVDLGDITYSNPYPGTWTPTVEYYQYAQVQYSLPGTTTPMSYFPFIYVANTDLPTSTQPVEPLVGPVTSATIDGIPFLTDQSSTNSLTPTISWQSPSVGVAHGYYVSLYKLSVSGAATTSTLVANFFTTSTSINMPPGPITAGQTYVFRIRALHFPGVDVSIAPFRTRFPYGIADTYSGMFTTN